MKNEKKGKEGTIFDNSLFPSASVFYINKRRLRNTLWILDYLSKHPCVDCKSKDILTLEFDHVRGKKEFNVGEMVQRGMSITLIKKEVSKCDVRCANCHTKKTAKEREYMSYLIVKQNFLKSKIGLALQAPIKKVKVNKNLM